MENSFLAKPGAELLGCQLTDSDDPRMARVGSLLQEGKITACEPLPKGSNSVFLLSLTQEGEKTRAIYKPRRGEIPLYDFPEGTLYRREYAAYLVSQALKWFLVPPTVIRDGPYGIGVLQWFVTTSPGVNYAALLKKHAPQFQRIATFDWLVNNADRKSGHCLEGGDGRLWVIDHGLTFHMAPKLRTVIWDFSGQPVPEELLADLQLFHQRLTSVTALTTALSQLLSPREVAALEERLRMILNRPVFPCSSGSYHSIPWPPF